MRRNPFARIAAIALGAGTLFWLGQGLHYPLYVSIPAAVLVYVATLLVMAQILGRFADRK